MLLARSLDPGPRPGPRSGAPPNLPPGPPPWERARPRHSPPASALPPASPPTHAPASAFPSLPPEVRALRRSEAICYEARRALGGLLALIDDPGVHDVLIQVPGPHGRGPRGAGDEDPGQQDPEARAARLWVDRGDALDRVEGWSASADAVRRLAVALIAAGGRHLDELNPCADVHLGGGIRVHAALPPIVVTGPALSIRLPRVEPPGFADLVARGLCDPSTASRLVAAVSARRNLLVTGGTATGKTTLLAALLDLVPQSERIITIEDVAELRPAHPHRIALEARQPNAEGAGEVTLERLLREALRMRPDRIVLGECRGPELATMLSALNTGHDGGAATLHASSIAGVPARLEALGALAGLDPPALARQAVSALDLVVHLERKESGERRIAGLGRPYLIGDRIDVEPLP